MNYTEHYNRLIDRARVRILAGYKERHHVLPRCMGGDNSSENLVDLTAEEHYVAHQLLVKMYPDVGGLSVAAVRMAKQCAGNKAYGWLRRRHAQYMSHLHSGNKYNLGRRGRRLSPEHIEALRLSNVGKKRSLESIEKMAQTKRGRKLPLGHIAYTGTFRGKHHSAETRAKLSAKASGKKQSAEHIANRVKASQSWYSAPRSEEYRNKISAALRGRKKSPFSMEHRAKMSASHKGKKLSDEHRAKIAESARRLAMSPEWRAKVSAGTRAAKACGHSFKENTHV
jgi:hypothetical protein